MHMKPGLVSVIIPTRNRIHYLKQAIDSVYAQTYTDFEILVIGDGSRDDTKNTLASYDSRLRYFHQKHAGVSAARNHGISKAQGEYVAFLDDDDLWAPDKLQHCVEFLSQHSDHAWLCCGFSFIDAQGSPLPREPIIAEKPDVMLHDIAMFTFIHTSSVIVRREALERAGQFPEKAKVSEDYHMWAKILAHGKGAALQKPLTFFRQHKGNTRLPFWQLLKENTRIIDYIMSTQAEGLASRKTYIRNLYRIVGDSLLYKRQCLYYWCFKLFCLKEAQDSRQ